MLTGIQYEGWPSLRQSIHMNDADVPRSGLPAPRLLRSGLSVSELVSDVDTAVPDSAGEFPLQAVRSVPLLPNRHSATTDRCTLLLALEQGRKPGEHLTPPFHSTGSKRAGERTNKSGGRCTPSPQKLKEHGFVGPFARRRFREWVFEYRVSEVGYSFERQRLLARVVTNRTVRHSTAGHAPPHGTAQHATGLPSRFAHGVASLPRSLIPRAVLARGLRISASTREQARAT